MVESMDEAKVKEIKSMIRAVIQSSKEGVLSKRFNREYHGITGQNVPYKELGFQSLDSYLKSIPDIVAIKVNRDGEKVYFAVADDSTAHLAKMISKQRSARKRNIIKVKPFRRPTFPTPRRSSSRTFPSRYGPLATPRSSYTSSSSPAPPKLRSVIYVPPTTTFRPMIRSDFPVKPSTSNTSLKFGSTYEVPPRFKKKQQEPPAGSKRKDSSSSFSTVSENSTEDQRTSLPDPKVEKMLKGVKDYKSLLNIYCSKKKGSLKAIYTSFQSPTFHWVSSVDIDGNRFTSSESANSKKEAEHFAAKAAIRGLFEDISTLINFEKYKNTDKVENEDTAEPEEQKMKSPSNTDDDESLAQNVKELMQSKPNGLWSTRFRFEYKNKFSEDPPQDILEKMQDWKDVVSMERFQDKIILYPVKEKPKKTTAEDQSPDNQKNKTESGNLNGESSKYDLQIKTIISPTTGEMRRSVTDRSSVSDDISGKEEPKLKIDKLQIKAAENPPIRSSWKGYVSHIENCSEFYIHRSNCSINDIMDLISEKYSSSEASPAVVSGYGKGDYCVAFYARDKCWCRAVILDHRKKAQQRLYTHPHQTEDTASQNGVDEYHVQYIDFGNKEKVPAYHVRLLSLECAKHPAQALRCQLHGMAISDVSSADTVKKFKDLTEDELTFQVIEYKDNAYSVELTTESDVNVNKLLCRQDIGVAPPALVYPAGKYWDVFVSYVGSVNDVSLILVGPEYSDKLDNLEDAMLKYYTEHTESVCDVKTGEVYSFMSEDAHYRVKVIELNQQEALVEFMDHGDSENVEISQLNSLPTQFRELPFQAITCGLASLEQFGQNDKVLNKLIDMALGKVLVAEIVNREGGIKVELIDTSTADDISVNEVCLKLITDEELTPKLPQANGEVNGFVSHIADDCIVSVQIQGTGLDRLDELMNDIRLHYTKATGAEDCVTRPQIGRLYCAKYPADGNWYRAVVKQILPTKKVEVLYVDYGNREVISISNLREPTTANPHITKLPYQSIDCQLAGLSGLVSSKTENSDLSKSLMEMVPTNEAIQIKVLLETKPPTVELYIEGNECSLNELFLQGHQPSLIERFIDGADVPLPSDSDTSSATDEVRVPSDHRLNDKRIVITNESHEAQKLSQTEKRVTLSDDTPDLQVSLNGCHGDGDYSNNNIKQVDNITEQAVERGHVDSLQEDSTSAYEEVRSQGDWQDEIENYDKLPMPSVLTIPDVGEFMDIHVSLVTDPNSFMCQPWSSYDDLNSLVDNMKEFYTNHIYKCPELKIGGFYAALYDDDEHWYRIQLKTVLNEHMVAMYMLDLGHYDVVAVENIQPLVSEFRKLPFQAITASLAGVKAKGDRFSDQAVNRFFELAYRREFVAQIVEKNLIDRETVIKAHLCDTSDDNADVYIEQLLIDEGLCDLDESGR